MTTTLGLHVLPGRCTGCGYHLATQGCHCDGSTLKADALARVNDAAPEDFRTRIDAAIRSAAALGEPFSANDLRATFADVPGPLIGARFNAAAKAGVIRRIGYVTSTKASTHGHPVAEWVGCA